MTRFREAGCLMQSLAGCGILLMLGCGCMFVASMSFRAAMPEAQPPVTVGGDCPVDEAQAFVDGIEDRMETVFGSLPLDALDDADSGEAMAQVVAEADLEAVRELRDAVARTVVPPCAKEVLEAELALMDEGIEILEQLQDCFRDADGVGRLCVPRALLRVTTRLPGHAERLSEGYEAIAAETGIELPEDFEVGGGDGGFKIEIDGDSDGSDFEIDVP